MALHEDPSWLADSACARYPDVDFFPPLGVSASEALEICYRCTVRTVCLEYALSQHEFGIWGGTTERARALMRRARRLHSVVPVALEPVATPSSIARSRGRGATVDEEVASVG